MTKSTRDRILYTLLTHPRATIHDLAQAVGINAISVRHHLSSLLANGLIQVNEERHGVGRPRLVYSLTEKGTESFPSKYSSLTNRLLNHLKETMSETAFIKLFTDIANNLANEHALKVNSLPLEEKLDVVSKILADEGLIIEWEKTGDDFYIQIVTCPYLHISQQHEEVCVLDKTLISKLLSESIEKVPQSSECKSNCCYVIHHKPVGEI